VLITAGPTFEDFDPVRFIGNRSSGKMGFALAADAVRRGADVTLVVGPTSLDTPPVRNVVHVRTAAEMHQAVMSRAGEMDVVIMAAAVADYAPERAPQKVPKAGDSLTLVLHKTPDILADLGHRRLASGRGPALIGFAAETEDVIARAIEKRAKKHVDLIVANDVARTDAGFDVDTNAVTIISAEGAESLPLQPKSRVAAEILDRVEKLLASKPHAVAGHTG
jgi:phosphopantothenoylcysteine decarboxylase/phosphopantothenate--cysteine ligase